MAGLEIDDIRRWRKRLVFFLALVSFSVAALFITGQTDANALRIEQPEIGTGSEDGRSAQSEATAVHVNPEAGKEALSAAVKSDANSARETEVLMPVCVSGAVRSPGVYHLPYGAYYLQAVEQAGGFNETAAVARLNLAAGLRANEMIYVPTLEEWEEQQFPAAATAGAGFAGAEPREEKISLNHAGAEELTRIPGVGDKTAAQIIHFRERYGAFETVEDIMKVPGIKEARFEQMRAYIQP